MKRIGGLFDAIASFENLYRAYRRARAGKRHRGSVERFTWELERELLTLRSELLEGIYRPGAFRSFLIHDPKVRTIHVAPFRDRVLHQAILGVLEPHLDRRLDFDSYACRRGKGVDAALARAVDLSRHAPWVLRSDIRKCFESIDHDLLLAELGRITKDGQLISLLERIVRAGGNDGRGLPIGNLTSQWFANVFLGRIDRWIRAEIGPPGYVRYMDDFGLFFSDRDSARRARDEMRDWIPRELRLELNERQTGIYAVRRGWPFLGFRVFPVGLDLRRETWRRFRKGLARLHHDWRRGVISAEEAAASAGSRIAHVSRARSRGLRRKELRLSEI